MTRPVSPMLATLVDKPFSSAGWFFEVKWDGYRAIAEVSDGKVKLYSRNQISFVDRFPKIVEKLWKIKHDVIIDGEIVALDDEGRPKFQLLQDYLKFKEGQLVYYVFDLLALDGVDLTKRPLSERKEKLNEVLPKSNVIVFGEHIEKEGEKFFEAASVQGLEGIMAKKADSTYQPGVRGRDWLKIKTHRRQEVVIAGFTKPRGSRKYFGSLILGVYERGKLVYVGHCGGGFDERSLSDIYKKLRPLVVKVSPFGYEPGTNELVTWVKPKLVGEVKFAEWTNEGLMRQPVFVGLREDKKASEVKRESEHQFAKEASEKVETIAGREVILTHPSKVFFPKEKITKGDLVDYYRSIAKFILPHLSDRPLALLRYPDGIKGEGFYHKDVGEIVPDWIETVPIRSESEGRTIDYALCQNEAALVYFVNLGCVDFHIWTSRKESLGYPDYAIIDLDPEDVPFENVIKTAEVAYDILEGARVEAFLKTSGGRGLHIYIPLGAKYSHDQAKDFAELICTLINQRLPQLTSMERLPSKRKGKVYLDYLQNGFSKNTVAVYSVRPREAALVSTPLLWSELTRKLSPGQFTIRNIRIRLEKVGDIFKPTLGRGVDLVRALRQLDR